HAGNDGLVRDDVRTGPVFLSPLTEKGWQTIGMIHVPVGVDSGMHWLCGPTAHLLKAALMRYRMERPGIDQHQTGLSLDHRQIHKRLVKGYVSHHSINLVQRRKGMAPRLPGAQGAVPQLFCVVMNGWHRCARI